MPRRLIITFAFLLAGLSILALPRSGRATPPLMGTSSAFRPTTISPGHATQSVRDACSLNGLVAARGSNCPDTSRLRRQAWGIPVIPDPVPIVKKVVGGSVSTAIKSVALAAILGWVASGAESALKQTAKVIDETTSPQLTSSWFSASYWRVAGIAALLTLPFLCAAAIHALVRSDLGLLTRAAFGYLPLSLLAVAVASQLTMLLLAGADEMSSIVASASLHADGVFLSTTSVRAVAESAATGDPFVTFLAAIITVAATLTLWLELLVRNAAVYVIVLMLPLFFAAMVWPARRTLAIRAIETLIALILSKFAIVAVLSLGGSALGHSTSPSAASVLTGGTLVLLAAFTPWALLRMLPLHEVASAAAGGLSHAPKEALSSAADQALKVAHGAALGAEWLGRTAAPDGESSILGGGSRSARRPTADAGSERGAERRWAGPVEAGAAGVAGFAGVAGDDADVAEPVSSAMSGVTGSGDLSGAATATAPTLTPGSEMATGDNGGESLGSSTRQSGADTDSAPSWPDVLRYPDTGAGDDPRLSLGNDLLDLANERRLLAAAADDEDRTPTPVDVPPSPALEPPLPPTRDAIGARPADARASGARSEPDEAPTPTSVTPPGLGFDPSGGGCA
jgi:hypothetical protein